MLHKCREGYIGRERRRVQHVLSRLKCIVTLDKAEYIQVTANNNNNNNNNNNINLNNNNTLFHSYLYKIFTIKLLKQEANYNI